MVAALAAVRHSNDCSGPDPLYLSLWRRGCGGTSSANTNYGASSRSPRDVHAITHVHTIAHVDS